MAGQYVPAFSWHEDIDVFVRQTVTEKPCLHVCAGPDSYFGDVRVDRYVSPKPPSVIANWRSLPFSDDSFACVFADPPWNIGYMKDCADFCKHALYIAPVVYVMSPWLWVHTSSKRTIWVREFPGINVPILLVRYERKNRQQLSLFA
jgi:hypothetical protein